MDTTSGTVSTNRAAEQMAEVIRGSCQAITGCAVKLQERNIHFSQNFFEVCNETLGKQAEANRTMAQGLTVQTRRQQEAFQNLSQEAVGAYLHIVDSMFSFYRARQVRNGKLPLENYDSLNVKAVIEQMDGLSVQEVKRLRDYEASNKNRRTLMEHFQARIEAIEANLPLANYDTLGVIGVMDRIEGLGVKEIERLRDYEARTKNRPTLIELFNGRIETS